MQLAGEVDGFDAENFIEKRLMVQTDRWTHMALAATAEAIEEAKLEANEENEWTISAITASSSGGNEFGQKEIQNLWGKGPVFVGAYQSIAWFYAATTGQISIRHGYKGPCGVVLAEGAGGLEALQHCAPQHPARDRERRQRRHRGPDRPVRAHLPALARPA